MYDIALAECASVTCINWQRNVLLVRQETAARRSPGPEATGKKGSIDDDHRTRRAIDRDQDL
jgi:hypothetical protein